MTPLSKFLLALAPLVARAQLVIDMEQAMFDGPVDELPSDVPPPEAAFDTDIRSDGKLCDATVQQHSGYVKFKGQGDYEKSYFFWMFESRDTPSEDPLVIWLSGGPGCSSQMAMMMENGPCWIQKNGEVVRNEHSWNNKANAIWVDQPAGTGFSSGSYVYGEDGVGEDFYGFLVGFFEQLPQYKGKELFITGESYAGHYIPAIAHHIYTMNKTAGSNTGINLKGIAIGNGLTNTEEQYKWYPQMAEDGGKALGGSLAEGRITNGVALGIMKASYWPCQKAIQACNHGWKTACFEAFVQCNYGEMVPYQLTRYNPYDMRIKCEHLPLCYDFSQVTAYFNKPEVQREIGAKGTWSACNLIVNKLFMADFMRSFHQGIPDLLGAGVDVLIYAGDVDYICNWLGNKAWTLALDWDGKDAFNEAEDEDYTMNGKSVGRLRSFKNFHFMQVYEAGHMVPMDQPEASLDMINKFMAGGMWKADADLLQNKAEAKPGVESDGEQVDEAVVTDKPLSADALLRNSADDIVIAEIKAALDAENATEPQDDAEGGRKWFRGETCCMCSKRLDHLGTLLYAASDYNHNYGSHNARWQCEHDCRHQCSWKGNGRYFGCYDESHLRSVNRQYRHRRGWNMWEEDHRGNIC